MDSKLYIPSFSPSRRRLLAAGAASPLVFSACGDFFKDGPGPTVSSQWNAKTVDAVRSGTLGPPMVSRALAMVNTAAFNAWAPYHPTAVATIPGGIARVPAGDNTQRNKEISISYAMYRVLVDVYPGSKALFDEQMAKLGLDPANTVQDGSAAGIGNQAAALLLASRLNDGSNAKSEKGGAAYSDYTGYVPVNTVTTQNDPAQWQPVKFSNGNTPGFLVPHWGEVKPFAMTSGSQLRLVRTMPTAASQEFRDQAAHILDVTSKLDDKQKVIAEFWSNGPKTETPPGYWNLIAQNISHERMNSLDDDVVMFFLQGNAVMDAGIACWDCKRAYNSARPVTAIRYLYADQRIPGYISKDAGIGLMDGATWSPWQPSTFISPPFAEFTSGHSTFSGASAEVLKRFFREDYYGGSYTVSASAVEANTPKSLITLSWNTFTDAANEAGISRIYGGIHFLPGNEVGKSMGRSIGGLVWDKTQRLLAGDRS